MNIETEVDVKKMLMALTAIATLTIGAAIPARAEMVANRPGGGQWQVTADGRVAATGGAPHYGDAYSQQLPDGRLLADVLWEPVIGMASTQSGHGYWLAARDSGVFTFGDAAYHGNLIDALVARDNLDPGTLNGDNILGYLHGEIVDIASTGDGYYLLGKDGGVFTFGHLPFHGSLSGQIGTDAVDLRIVPGGYVIVGANQGEWTCQGGACSLTNAPPPSPDFVLTSGTYPLSDVPVGWYRLDVESTDSTYHSFEDPGGDIVRNEFTDGPQALYVDATGGAASLEIRGRMTPLASPRDVFVGSGVFRVGVDVAPGTYRLQPDGGSSYWAATDRYGDIRDNDFVDGPGLVNLQAGDELVHLRGTLVPGSLSASD